MTLSFREGCRTPATAGSDPARRGPASERAEAGQVGLARGRGRLGGVRSPAASRVTGPGWTWRVQPVLFGGEERRPNRRSRAQGRTISGWLLASIDFRRVRRPARRYREVAPRAPVAIPHGPPCARVSG